MPMTATVAARQGQRLCCSKCDCHGDSSSGDGNGHCTLVIRRRRRKQRSRINDACRDDGHQQHGNNMTTNMSTNMTTTRWQTATVNVPVIIFVTDDATTRWRHGQGEGRRIGEMRRRWWQRQAGGKGRDFSQKIK